MFVLSHNIHIHLHSSKSTAKKNKQTNERTNKHIYICASLFTKTW